uniref:Uncharacterized protein n=1 Tax=Leersia perrieri TaxID=77586 RepID=A0A0D9W953_9ORYZ
MARLLSRTLALARASALLPSSRRAAPIRGLSTKVEFIEIDLSEDAPSSSSTSAVEGDGDGGGSATGEMGMRRLEHAIHAVLVQRAAPEWLPFVPGGSYLVPEMRSGVADLVGALVQGRSAEAMTEEERMCLTTVRGWPSAAYFVDGEFGETCLTTLTQ